MHLLEHQAALPLCAGGFVNSPPVPFLLDVPFNTLHQSQGVLVLILLVAIQAAFHVFITLQLGHFYYFFNCSIAYEDERIDSFVSSKAPQIISHILVG